MRLTFLSLIGGMLLTGCANIPLTSMYKLSQLSPLEADPGQINVVIRTNEAIRLSKGDARIFLGYQADDQSLIIEDEYLIEINMDNTASAELMDDMRRGEALTFMQLSSSDAEQMRASQALIKQHKASGKDGQGSFSISIHSSCLQKPLPKGAVMLDIFMQTSEQDAFFVFNQDLDLRSTAFPNGRRLEDWPLCESIDS